MLSNIFFFILLFVNKFICCLIFIVFNVLMVCMFIFIGWVIGWWISGFIGVWVVGVCVLVWIFFKLFKGCLFLFIIFFSNFILIGNLFCLLSGIIWLFGMMLCMVFVGIR